MYVYTQNNWRRYKTRGGVGVHKEMIAIIGSERKRDNEGYIEQTRNIM